MIRKTTFALLALGAVVSASAQFTSGNLVVVRFGDGSAALGTAGCATFLDEYTIGGTPGASHPMPVTGSGANRAFVNRGSSTSEGALTLSGDKKYLMLAGYDAAVGTTPLSTVASTTINRVFARVSGDGTIDTSTALTDSYSGDSVRGAYTTDGTDFWTFGTASVAATAGVRYTTYGSTTAIQLGTPPTNIRRAAIYNGQLYISSASGTFQGVSSVGTGMPTTSGQTIAVLPGFPTMSGPSNYDFYFDGTNTVYVADDRPVASGGGIQKWTFDGFTWTLAYTLTSGITAGPRNIAVDVSSEDAVTIYATTGETPNRLVSVVDSGALSTFSELAVAATNTGFRGIAFAPTSGSAVSGTVDLQAWGADLSIPPVTFEIYPSGGGSLLETHTVNLDGSGNYAFTSALANGSYDMFARGATWLAKLDTLTISGGAGSVNYALINGDCDGDNEVTLVDNGIMAASFGKSEGDEGYDPRADLDGDMEVNIVDSAIIANSFGIEGDSY